MNQFSYLQKFCFAALFSFVLSSLETATDHVKEITLKCIFVVSLCALYVSALFCWWDALSWLMSDETVACLQSGAGVLSTCPAKWQENKSF